MRLEPLGGTSRFSSRRLYADNELIVVIAKIRKESHNEISLVGILEPKDLMLYTPRVEV